VDASGANVTAAYSLPLSKSVFSHTAAGTEGLVPTGAVALLHAQCQEVELRSPFVALRGQGDSFASVHELARDVRTDVFVSTAQVRQPAFMGGGKKLGRVLHRSDTFHALAPVPCAAPDLPLTPLPPVSTCCVQVPVFDDTEIWINNYAVDFMVKGISAQKRVDHHALARKKAKEVDHGIHRDDTTRAVVKMDTITREEDLVDHNLGAGEMWERCVL
jgi:hypothetical protein